MSFTGAEERNVGPLGEHAQSSPEPEYNRDTRPRKRARKALNCQPCRISKLKCDKNRPCSSCVLRRTSALCYRESSSEPGDDSPQHVLDDDNPRSKLHAAQELARLRRSIDEIEAYIFSKSHNPPKPQKACTASPKGDAPGLLERHGKSDFYAGPTSAVLHLLPNDVSKRFADPDDDEATNVQDFPPLNNDYDRDILRMLPRLDVIDSFLDHYFKMCNWIIPSIYRDPFMRRWEHYKSGKTADRITLATTCAILANVMSSLHPEHELLATLPDNPSVLGSQFYNFSTLALQRLHAESKVYTLELVEVLVLRSRYLMIMKRDSEELWTTTGELIRIETAMGLHRDPGKWGMDPEIQERRRWAWWQTLILERYHAFLLGRPIAIAQNHWDTQLPSTPHPGLPDSHTTLSAFFRLIDIVGDVLESAVSVNGGSYEDVLKHDRALVQWLEDLPAELDADEYRLSRKFASSDMTVRRRAVQSVVILSHYYHIRFALHRPYAQMHWQSPCPKNSQSLEIAVANADKLITLVNLAPVPHKTKLVPGHMGNGSFHCFSATMFFAFQLIANPEQPGAHLFQASLRKGLKTLEDWEGSSAADKGHRILTSLAPLYSPEFRKQTLAVREKQHTEILCAVRKLAFPCHSSDDPDIDGKKSESTDSTHSTSPPVVSNASPVYSTSSIPETVSTDDNASLQAQMNESGQQFLPNMTHVAAAGGGQPYMIPQLYPGGSFYPQFAQPSGWTPSGAENVFYEREWSLFVDGMRPGPAPTNYAEYA